MTTKTGNDLLYSDELHYRYEVDGTDTAKLNTRVLLAGSAGVVNAKTVTRVRQVFTAAAVNEDVDPGAAFQLVAIEVLFNSAPTTSENIAITSINDDADVSALYTFDPSSPSGTSFRWMPGQGGFFDDGTTLAIDYTNTDGRTITVNTIYLTDTSVG